jgi:RNA polymerase sigma-70 factor (ECF subfamily)
MLNNREYAEDVLQETFLDAFRKLDSFSGKASFGAWVKKIAINKCINVINRRQFKFESIENDTLGSTEENDEDYGISLRPERVHASIKQLPDGCRVIFNLYQLEGSAHNEIDQIGQ